MQGIMRTFIVTLFVAIPVLCLSQNKVKYEAPSNFSYVDEFRISSSETLYVYPKAFKVGGCTFPVPQGAKDLKSGFEFKYSILSKNAAASLQVLGFGGGNYDRKAVHVVVEFMQKQHFVCMADTVTFGAGLIALLSIEKQSGKVDVTNLPQVAASVTLGKLKASYSLKTIGITGPIALNALPSNFEFDTESYKEFFKVIDLIKSLYETDPDKLNICPQLLPFTTVVVE